MTGIVYQTEVTISAPVKDTEVIDRVGTAIHNLFPTAQIDTKEGFIIGVSHSVDRFSELIHQRAILDTARGELFGGSVGQTIRFRLKKQAAFQGVVNFAVGSPGELGDIEVEILVKEPDIETFIDYIAPPTEDGKPIRSDSNP